MNELSSFSGCWGQGKEHMFAEACALVEHAF